MTKRSKINACRASCGFLFGTLVLVLGGCAGGKGKVSGKVSLDGKTLTTGMVAFFAKDNTVKQASIQSDGTYSMEGVPAGPAKVTVTVVDAGKIPNKGMGEMDRSKMGGKGSATDKGTKAGSDEAPSRPETVTIPRRYNDPDKSGLTFEVKAGEDNKFDIPLTSGTGGEKAE